MRKLLLSASFVTIFVMGLNFLFKIYLSYHIDKKNLGLFYTFMDLVSIGIMLFSGYKDSLVKAYDEADFGKVTYWYIISFWAFFGFVLLAEEIYYTIYFHDKIFPVYYLASILFVNALAIFLSYYNASWKVYKVMLFENLFMTFSTISLYFLFNIFLAIENIQALFWAFFGGYLGRSVYLKIRSPMFFKVERSRWGEVSGFFKNNLLSALMYFFSGLFISASSLVILKLYQDTVFLSEYQVVIRSIFFSLVAVFVFPLNTFTFPQISKFVSENRLDEIRRIEGRLLLYLSIFLILIFMSMPIVPYIIGFAFPKEYYESYKMLNFLLPTLPFIAYTTFALNIIKGFNRFELALCVRVSGSLIFFVSVFLFHKYGYDSKSVVYALIFSFLTMSLLAMYYKKRLLQ
jgi:O-antigen/teichoic acid export membrane protein